MTTATALRAIAVVMAVFAMIDPAVSRLQRPPLEVDLAVPRHDDAPVESPGPNPANRRARRRLVRDLRAAVADDVQLRTREFDPGEPLPCAADGPCVVVIDTAVAPRGASSGTVRSSR